MFVGKLFGTLFGFLVAGPYGPYGAVVGFLFGLLYDRARYNQSQQLRRKDNRIRGKNGARRGATGRRKNKPHRIDLPLNSKVGEQQADELDRSGRNGRGASRRVRGSTAPPPPPPPPPSADAHSSGVGAAYAMLGVSPLADKAKVKMAYRKLMSAYHPDKLASKGLTEEQLKVATEKSQKVRNAYDAIMKAKGW